MFETEMPGELVGDLRKALALWVRDGDPAQLVTTITRAVNVLDEDADPADALMCTHSFTAEQIPAGLTGTVGPSGAEVIDAPMSGFPHRCLSGCGADWPDNDAWLAAEPIKVTA